MHEKLDEKMVGKPILNLLDVKFHMVYYFNGYLSVADSSTLRDVCVMTFWESHTHTRDGQSVLKSPFIPFLDSQILALYIHVSGCYTS